MSGRIPREFIDELLVRVDIVDLIDSHVPLKKTGANFVARCPFHTEKTPSFSVNRNKQFFHCFGCGASGNAIGFLMDYSHLDFVEAVEELAAFAGLDVPRESAKNPIAQKKDNLTAIYELMDRVAALYAEQLRDTRYEAASAYLAARGVSSESADDYMLGYAPDDWRFLANRFDQKLLLEAGLLVTKDDGHGYDRFRNRIMFPIRDKRARIIGFGGRVLDDSLPKYLNSPETSLFHKGKEVYGLFELLEKDPKPSRILIVEGYMDVIALAQYGINNAVATLGTAASQAHLDLLFKVAPELVFCFDGDKAGRAAAWRAMEPAFSSLKDGRQVRIMLLPVQHDPDSLIREVGVDGFIGQIQVSEALSDYFFRQIQEGVNLSAIEGRAQLVNKAKPYLDRLTDGIFKDMMVSNLQDLSGAKRVGIAAKTMGSERSAKNKRPVGQPERMTSARVAIALLLQNPKLAILVRQREIDWDGLEFPGIDLFRQVVDVIIEHKPANTAVLLEFYRGSPEQRAINALAFVDLPLTDEAVEAEFEGALDRLLEYARSAAIDRLLAKEKAGGLDSHERKALLKMLMVK